MRWTPLLASLFLVSCLDSVVVEGDGFVLDTEPRLETRELVDPGAAVVISEEGAQVLADNLDPLARALLDLPEQGPLDLSGLVADILEANPRILGNFTLTDVELSVAFPNEGGVLLDIRDNPSRIRIDIDEMWIDIEATGTQPSRPGSFACRVRGKIDEGTPNERMLTLRNIEVEVELGAVDGRFDIGLTRLEFEIEESGFDVVTDRGDPNYYCNFPECDDGLSGCAECHAICGGAGILEDVGNFLAQFLDGILGNLVEVLANQLITVFEQLGGEVHPARFLGSYAPDLVDSHRLEFGARPASDGIEVVGAGDEQAIAVQLALGLRAKEAHPCIGPDVKIPAFSAGSPPASAAGGGHLSLGVPAALLNQLLWSAYRAGSLCLQISSDDLSQVSRLAGGDLRITAGTISLLLPGLDQVVGQDSPLLISLGPYLDPNDPEVVALGSGLPLGPEEGADLDSLLKLELPPLELGIHAWVEGRWLRLFGLQAEVSADVTPSLRMDGGIDITIDNLDVDNVTETYNELFGGVQLEQLFTAAFDLALGLLTGGGIELPIDLQTLLATSLGIPLEVELTGLRSAGGNGDWLLVTADLAGASQELVPRPTDTLASAPAELEPGTEVPLSAMAVGLAGEPVWRGEVQYRVDGGAWRRWQPAGELTVPSAWFLVPGVHVIEVRSRDNGDWRTVDPTPSRVLVKVVEALAVEPEADSHAGEGGCSSVAAPRATRRCGGSRPSSGCCFCASVAPEASAGLSPGVCCWRRVWGSPAVATTRPRCRSFHASRRKTVPLDRSAAASVSATGHRTAVQTRIAARGRPAWTATVPRRGSVRAAMSARAESSAAPACAVCLAARATVTARGIAAVSPARVRPVARSHARCLAGRTRCASASCVAACRARRGARANAGQARPWWWTAPMTFSVPSAPWMRPRATARP